MFQAGLWIYFLIIWFLPIMNNFIGLIIIFLIGQVFYFYILVNAISTAKKLKIVEPKSYDKWYVYLLIIISISLSFEFIYKPSKNRFAKYQLARNSSTTMAPTLTIEDKFVWKQTKNINKNDITLFGFPGDSNSLYVYRCIANPGDRLEIKKGLVYINGKLTDVEHRLKFQYIIQTTGPRFYKSLSEKIGTDEILTYSNQNEYSSYLTRDQKEKIKNLPFVTKIEPHFMPYGVPMDIIFPFDTTTHKWNIDFFGPITLPKKGETISINSYNSIIYETIIKQSENEVSIKINEQGLLENNGIPLNSYTFKHDYYFMMGDNRHNSGDSRYRGLVPDNLIKGKVLYICWSKDKNKIGVEL
jgi:signal peptidase I